MTAILEVESFAFRAWPAAETLALGGWQLRFTGGVTRRGNSVWPAAPSGLALGAAIERAEAFYAERAAPPRFQIFPADEPTALEGALAERGYAVETPVSVQLAEAAAVMEAACPENIDAVVGEAPDPEWWSVAGERSRFAAVPDVYRALLGRLGARAGFATARLGGEAIATGLGVVEGGFAGVFSMLTLPERRARGAGRALLRALARWARGRGAERMMLQVERDNPAALALYARVGFHERYGYHYRLGPAR